MELKFEFLETLLQYDYVQINRPWLFNHPRVSRWVGSTNATMPQQSVHPIPRY
jgi:hypothetical protein